MRPGGLDEARRHWRPRAAVAAVNHSSPSIPTLITTLARPPRSCCRPSTSPRRWGPARYLLTGGRGCLIGEAAERFAALIAPCIAAARPRGAAARGERHFFQRRHPYRPHAARYHHPGRIAGIGLCIDFHACWTEAGLKALLRQAMPITGLVQVSDYVLGDRISPCRAVPGDGVIPLERLLATCSKPGTKACSTSNWSARASRRRGSAAPSARRKRSPKSSHDWEPEPMAYGDGPTDAALRKAWDLFCDRLRAAGDDSSRMPTPPRLLHRADALRFLTQNLGQAFDLALETKDPAFPQLHPFVRRPASWAVTSPISPIARPGSTAHATASPASVAPHAGSTSRCRARALIESLARTGRASTSRSAIFPKPISSGTRSPPRPTAVSSSSSGGRRAKNWLPTTPGRRKPLIREAFDAGSRPDHPHDPADRHGLRLPLPTPERMIEATGWAGNFLTSAMRDWPEHTWKTRAAYATGFTNQLPPHRPPTPPRRQVRPPGRTWSGT